MIKVLNRTICEGESDGVACLFVQLDWRSPMSSHETTVFLDKKTHEALAADEIAFGEWWDWDMKNLDDDQKSLIEEAKRCAFSGQPEFDPNTQRV